MPPGAFSCKIPNSTVFLVPSATLQIQSVIYHNDIEGLERSAASIGQAAKIALSEGVCGSVHLRYGDSASKATLDQALLNRIQEAAGYHVSISYDPFCENLGSARGHNRLASVAQTNFILVENPDVVLSPRLLCQLLTTFQHPGVGMVEGKQIPIEHPKDYDPVTGETCWATTACAMIPLALFQELNGFDADSFFLYGDDVDFSWLVRLAGFKVIFKPGAMLYHDKRLTQNAAWKPSGAERRYSAECSLMLAHKWSRPDLVRQYLDMFGASDDEELRRAARIYLEKQESNALAMPLDPDHRIGQFIDNMFATHRFEL